jgi:phage terminase large subunit-like protein
MRRFLLCLPLCLLFTACDSNLPGRPSAPDLADVADDGKQLPSTEQMERLARANPVAFLENCLRRCQRDVQGYHLTFIKHELIGNKLKDREVIEVWFREEPHSVYFRWIEGAGKAERAVYVAGANNNKILVRPSGVAARILAGSVVEREVDGSDARQSGRYTLHEFGLKKGALRTLDSWKAARERGSLEVEFLGEESVAQVGGRVCWKLSRPRYEQPEEDGVTGLTVYIDKENWLQVGAVLTGEGGKLIGEYWFRDIHLNPDIGADQFKREALTP